jgi:mercuric ion transport protein
MRAARVFAGSILAAVLASFCCIGPLLVAATGLGSLSYFGRFEAARPYLLAISIVLLVSGVIWSLRKRQAQCAQGTACETRSASYWVWLVVPVLAVAAAAAFPYYSGGLLAVAGKNPASSVPAANRSETVQFRVTGMTCEACASGLAASFRNLAGVQAATVDYPSGDAVVTYASGQVSVEQLAALVREAGYEFHR